VIVAATNVTNKTVHLFDYHLNSYRMMVFLIHPRSIEVVGIKRTCSHISFDKK
jgi:hypothetical protein